jgi:hypothetical protein
MCVLHVSAQSQRGWKCMRGIHNQLNFEISVVHIHVHNNVSWEPGEITPSYILHTRAFGTYLLGGLFTLQFFL